MTLRFFDWIRSIAGKPFSQINAADVEAVLEEVHVRELAYWSIVGLIARLVSKCEFQTFVRGSPVKGDEWYAWNVSPNANQSSTQFIAQIVHKLYGDRHEALVVDVGGKLLVADSYSVEERAITDSVYTDVTIGSYTLRDRLYASDVLLFRQTPENMRVMTNLLYETYGKLIAYCARTYQASRARKGVLNMGAPQFTDVKRAKEEMEVVNLKFKNFFGANDAVLPLYEGQSYTDMSGSKTYTLETTRDLRQMIDDVLTFDARALGIPPALVKGDVVGIDDALRLALTSCIDPLCDMLSEEITRKRYRREATLRGDYMRVDTSAILHTDVLNNAVNVEKLISSGAFSVNDVLRRLGQPAIPEPWADEHYITKNFEEVKKANGDPAQV